MSVDFNLAAPPDFRGLNPDLPVRRYLRHLPHWRQDGATYFVTARLADAIPQQQLRALKRARRMWEYENPAPRSETQWHEFARIIASQTEAYLDQGYGECILADPRVLPFMCDSLTHFQSQHYFTSAYVIMPNHFHAVIRPYSGYELEDVLKNAKGYVSRRANRVLNKQGQRWEQESYDRIVRDEEHLWRAVQYIGDNPRKAGLPRESWNRWIHPSWQDAGWVFQD